ncbi:hypothetical protein MesoLjLa_49820 [Mesorhizobium sp. L-2-11]|nr:hypothetical protein MesoLjLa_49820 [Mesorhizobium sp. L-2-11]
MKRRNRSLGKVPDYGEVENIDVKMQHVEFIGPPSHLFKHHHVVGNVVPDPWIQAQRNIATRDQFGRGA